MKSKLRKFLEAKKLSDLKGSENPLKLAQEWSRLAHEEMKNNERKLVGSKPEKLDFLKTETNGITFKTYGVVHGWIGGGSQDYREFVRNTIEKDKNIIFEKMLGRFYLGKGSLEIPDFVVIGNLGQFVLGLKTMILWPMFLFWAIYGVAQEFFTRKEPEEVKLSEIFSSKCYHNIDPELRRAIGDSLPTPLQIEYEMRWWKSWKKYFSDEHLFAIVPRSAYMAEFAKSWAEENQISELGILVGDRHLTEVDFFFKNQVDDKWIRAKAKKHAKAMSKSKFYYNILFAVYFCKLLLGAACGSVIWLAIAFFIMIL